MSRERYIQIAAALALFAITLGGCPSNDTALLAPAQPSSSTEDAGTDQPETSVLDEVVTSLANDDQGTELAQSESDGWVSISDGSSPGGYYPPGFNPYAPDSSGSNNDNHNGDNDGGESGDDQSGGSDGGGASDGDGATGGAYDGSVSYAASEHLDGSSGGVTTHGTYFIRMEFDDGGAPQTIPVPIYVTQDLFPAEVRNVGDTDSTTVQFADNAAFDVLVTVLSATYTPQNANVTLSVDVSWHGEHSSIVAAGTHTLSTSTSGVKLSYTSSTHYDFEMFAEGDAEHDDWIGSGWQEFQCDGTLNAN